jgi:uncharacterized protein YggE
MELGQRPTSSRPADEEPPTLNSAFLDAYVLMNVKADTYVAAFGVSEEAPTVAEARAKVGAVMAKFSHDVGTWNAQRHLKSDFVGQNRVYDFELNGNTATEKLVGFDVKENASITCASVDEVDELIALAAKDGIFDLIKVDYVVTDQGAAKEQILEAASKVIHQKEADYQRLLGISLKGTPQLYADKFDMILPTESYVSYQASEGETIDPGFQTERYAVHGARKMRTFYYKPLNGKGFDKVINPVVTEPVVQFTLYLKLRYTAGDDNRHTVPGDKA